MTDTKTDLQEAEKGLYDALIVVQKELTDTYKKHITEAKAEIQRLDSVCFELKEALSKLYKIYEDFCDSDDTTYPNAYYSFYKYAYDEWTDAGKLLEKLKELP